MSRAIAFLHGKAVYKDHKDFWDNFFDNNVAWRLDGSDKTLLVGSHNGIEFRVTQNKKGKIIVPKENEKCISCDNNLLPGQSYPAFCAECVSGMEKRKMEQRMQDKSNNNSNNRTSNVTLVLPEHKMELPDPKIRKAQQVVPVNVDLPKEDSQLTVNSQIPDDMMKGKVTASFSNESGTIEHTTVEISSSSRKNSSTFEKIAGFSREYPKTRQLPNNSRIDNKKDFATMASLKVEAPLLESPPERPMIKRDLDNTVFVETYSTMGSSHKRNEDSVHTYESDLFIAAIVADGCSSGNRSDIGSMIHVAAFEKFMNEISASSDVDYYFQSKSAFIGSYLRNLVSIKEKYNGVFTGAESFELNVQSLLSTVLMIVIPKYGGKFFIASIGDGIFFLRRKDDPSVWKYMRFDYEGNAPLYPIYLSDTEFREKYSQANSNIECNIESGFIDKKSGNFDVTKVMKIEGLNPNLLQYDKELFDLAILSTDGIDSCYRINEEKRREDVSTIKMFMEITNLPNEEYTPGFLNRRVENGILKKKGVMSSDDMTIVFMNIPNPKVTLN
jgi:serine/threonine protein phosphatase PrpC